MNSLPTAAGQGQLCTLRPAPGQLPLTKPRGQAVSYVYVSFRPSEVKLFTRWLRTHTLLLTSSGSSGPLAGMAQATGCLPSRGKICIFAKILFLVVINR